VPHYTAARCHTPTAASVLQLMLVTPATATLNSGPETCAQRNRLDVRSSAVPVLTAPLSGHRVMINGHALCHRSPSFMAAIPIGTEPWSK